MYSDFPTPIGFSTFQILIVLFVTLIFVTMSPMYPPPPLLWYAQRTLQGIRKRVDWKVLVEFCIPNVFSLKNFLIEKKDLFFWDLFIFTFSENFIYFFFKQFFFFTEFYIYWILGHFPDWVIKRGHIKKQKKTDFCAQMAIKKIGCRQKHSALRSIMSPMYFL